MEFRPNQPRPAAPASSLFRLEFGIIIAAMVFLLFTTARYPSSVVSKSSVYLTGQAIEDMSFFRETQITPPPTTDTKDTKDTTEDVDKYPLLTSAGKVFGTVNGVGAPTKRYFRFTNVQLTDNNTLTFFLPPGMQPPPPQIVDIIINNASTKSPSLPTTVTVRAGKLHQYQYLNIKYVEAEKYQPQCKKWEKRPVYLLTMQLSENIWHAWADGLLGAFQTLREQGLLPLAEIDNKGNMKEYIDDLPEECPVEILLGNGAGDGNNDGGGSSNSVNSIRECKPRRNVVKQSKCNPATELWCRPGLVVGGNATAAGGPVLLPYKGTEVVRRWHHLFEALVATGGEIINWDSSFGTCFSEIYIGKSNVLQFYMPLKMGKENTNVNVLSQAKEQRSNSTAAVKSFMLTAERLHRAMRHAKKPKLRRWPGYIDSRIEKLRQGIGPENIDLVNALRPTKERAAEFGQMTSIEWGELDGLLKQSEKAVVKAVELAEKRSLLKNKKINFRRRHLQQQQGQNNSVSGNKEYVTEKPRPVLTYMWRSTFKRSVLNAHDILTYVLSRYNVTVHVTTFEEPSLEAMELMSTTDVLVGMHGAGWTNSLFIKRGAASLQLLPYGWLIKGGGVIRGAAFQSMLLASDSVYVEWGNLRKEHSFMRRHDFINKIPPIEYALHPQSSWPLPTDKRPGNYWVYQNTFVDILDLAPHIDSLMERVGIYPMD